MKYQANRLLRFGVNVAACVCAIFFTTQSALAVDISFRNFSPSAALGPPADEYAVKLASISTIVLGEAGQVRFAKYSPTPARRRSGNAPAPRPCSPGYAGSRRG